MPTVSSQRPHESYHLRPQGEFFQQSHHHTIACCCVRVSRQRRTESAKAREVIASAASSRSITSAVTSTSDFAIYVRANYGAISPAPVESATSATPLGTVWHQNPNVPQLKEMSSRGVLKECGVVATTLRKQRKDPNTSFNSAPSNSTALPRLTGCAFSWAQQGRFSFVGCM